MVRVAELLVLLVGREEDVGAAGLLAGGGCRGGRTTSRRWMSGRQNY